MAWGAECKGTQVIPFEENELKNAKQITTKNLILNQDGTLIDTLTNTIILTNVKEVYSSPYANAYIALKENRNSLVLGD